MSNPTLEEISLLRQEVEQLREKVAQMERARPRIRTDHPYIMRIQGVHGGRPTIRGAGVSVQSVVEQTRLGRSPEQIVEDFDGILTLSQVHAALSYYYAHPNEIEQYIAESREAQWKTPRASNST